STRPPTTARSPSSSPTANPVASERPTRPIRNTLPSTRAKCLRPRPCESSTAPGTRRSPPSSEGRSAVDCLGTAGQETQLARSGVTFPVSGCQARECAYLCTSTQGRGDRLTTSDRVEKSRGKPVASADGVYSIDGDCRRMDHV